MRLMKKILIHLCMHVHRYTQLLHDLRNSCTLLSEVQCTLIQPSHSTYSMHCKIKSMVELTCTIVVYSCNIVLEHSSVQLHCGKTITTITTYKTSLGIVLPVQMCMYMNLHLVQSSHWLVRDSTVQSTYTSASTETHSDDATSSYTPHTINLAMPHRGEAHGIRCSRYADDGSRRTNYAALQDAVKCPGWAKLDREGKRS